LLEKPAIDTKLTSVLLIPRTVREFSDGTIFRSRLVVDDDELLVRSNPDIVHTTGDSETSLGFFVFNTHKRVTPSIHVFVFERHRLDIVLRHNRMWCAGLPVNVEFLLEEFINCNVEVEGRKRWALGTEFIVEIETAWTLEEEVYLRAG